MTPRGKVLTTDGRVVDVTDKEWQYGRWWSKKIDQFNRELYSFRNPVSVEKGGELREHHFKRIVSALWPEDGPKPFVWHPWAQPCLMWPKFPPSSAMRWRGPGRSAGLRRTR